MERFRTVGIKISFSIVTLIVVIIGTLALISFSNSKSTIEQQVQSNLITHAQDVGSYISERLGRIVDDVEDIAGRPKIQSMNQQQQLTSTVQQFGDSITTIHTESSNLEEMVEDLQEQIRQFKL